jgi:uncharacterized protein (DUF983 family)
VSEPALPPLTSSPILKAISGRCPRCGQGRLFQGFLTVCARCPVCALSFAGHDAADGPAVFITFITGTVGAGGALWLELANPQPFWVHAMIWPPVIVGLSLLLLRPLKGAFIGAQWKYRVGEWELGR